MSQQYLGLLSQPVIAANPIAVRTFVGYDGNQASVQGQKVLGVAEQPATAAGQCIPVIAIGTAIVLSGAALSPGQAVISDNQGRAIPATGPLAIVAGATAVTSTAANGPAILTGSALPEYVVGYVLPGQSVSGAGLFVEILLKQ